MFEIIDIPTKQTTAATDVIMAILSLWVMFKVNQVGKGVDLKKTKIWLWVFGLLALASILGAIAHGFKMSSFTYFILWQPLYLSLGISIGLFVAGVIYDYRNFTLPGFLIPALLFVATVFFMITAIFPNNFIIFIIYEAVAMLLAFSVYSVLAWRRKVEGSWLMAAGILMMIIAAIIQTIKAIKFNLIWEFDQNSAFHFIQMIGLIFLLKGLLTEFSSRKKLI